MAFEAFLHNNQDLLEVEKHLAENKLQEAAAVLNRLQQTSTSDPRVYFLGSRLGQLARNPERALAAIDRTVEMAPTWNRALMQRAFVLVDLRRDTDALKMCERVIELNPQDFEAAFFAAEIGKRVNDTKTPETLLLRAHQASPKNVSIWFELARFFSTFDAERSLHWVKQVLQLQPNNVGANILAALVTEPKDPAAALQFIDRALVDAPNDEALLFHRKRLTGETPAQLPTQIVEGLFDSYATRFDMHLVNKLEYRVPKIVAEKILASYPDRRLNILDLGCGTGLLGLYVGRIEGFFVGVDVSRGMVEQAAKLEVYQRFHLVDANEALEATDANEYEVIAANDVLIYVGDATRMIAGAHKVLRPNGQFFFTCEAAKPDEPALVLRNSQRYAHSKASIEAACRAAGFARVTIEDMVIRKESETPVDGFLVTAQKAG